MNMIDSNNLSKYNKKLPICNKNYIVKICYKIYNIVVK